MVYCRSVYVLVYTVGLSVEQMQSLEIWRNVMIAAIPPQLADALPDLQLLRSTVKCVCCRRGRHTGRVTRSRPRKGRS